MKHTHPQPSPANVRKPRWQQGFGEQHSGGEPMQGLKDESTTPTCACDTKLAAAEAELRAKAKRHPELAAGYGQAALEVARVRNLHFKACLPCQAIEDAKEAA